MPAPSSELPPWLRRSGAAKRDTKGRTAAAIAFGVVVFAAGAGAGFLYARRDVAAAPPPPPAPVCPPAVVCPSVPAGTGGEDHAKEEKDAGAVSAKPSW